LVGVLHDIANTLANLLYGKAFGILAVYGYGTFVGTADSAYKLCGGGLSSPVSANYGYAFTLVDRKRDILKDLAAVIV